MFARQPDNSRLLIMMAELLGGQEGLDLLLELEAGGYSPDQEDEEYGQRKIILMAEAGIFHAKYAEHISEQQLFELAIQLHQAGESRAVDVARWLKKNTANELETGLLQQIVTEAKTPEKLWSADVDDSISELLLSPCGSWLIYNVFKDTTVETHFVHLDSDSWQSPEHPAAGWVWNPEATMAAGISGDNNIVVYDASNDDTAYIAVQGKLGDQYEQGGRQVIGWKESDTLLVSFYEGQQDNQPVHRLLQVEAQGNFSWLGAKRPGWPALTDVGHLVWVRQEEGDLVVERQDESVTYELRGSYSTIPLDWSPDQRLLILSTQAQEGLEAVLVLDSGVQYYPGFYIDYTKGYWLDNSTVWGMFFIQRAGYALVAYDITTDTLEYGGLWHTSWFNYSSAGDVVAAVRDGAVAVYDLSR